jgi:hypothetical protein
MIDQLPQQAPPHWLTQIIERSGDFISSRFPVEALSTNSVYYPTSGLDGTPVKWLAGNFYSFVYTDYLMTKEDLVDDLEGPLKRNGFKGYKPVLQREIRRDEIVPARWQPSMLPDLETYG